MKNFNNISKEAKEQFVSILTEELEDNYCPGDYPSEPSEMHQKLFNEDYFIIGYYEANEWLKENVGAFKAIWAIQEYEKEMFGAVNTDLSCCEKVANMFAYIVGEELINEVIDEKKSVMEIVEDLKENY